MLSKEALHEAYEEGYAAGGHHAGLRNVAKVAAEDAMNECGVAKNSRPKSSHDLLGAILSHTDTMNARSTAIA